MTDSAESAPAQSSLELQLRGGRGAAREAREQVAAANGMVPGSARADLLLLLTELVTNAVRHGGACNGRAVGVAVVRSSRGLTVAVTDPGAGFEWRRPEAASFLEARGYGLVLVDRLAHRWGIEQGDESTTVWFELSPD